MVLTHLAQLRSKLTGQLHTLFNRRIRVKGLALDLVEQVWATTQELVVRELPDLLIGRSGCVLSGARTTCAARGLAALNKLAIGVLIRK